ncbi:cytochrome b561 [compost metagenome]
MANRFPLMIRLLHWTMAVLILAMLFIGVGMLSTAGPAYTALLSLHRPLGAALFMLAVIRLSIRLQTRTPPLPDNASSLLKAVVKASHALLYGAMIAMPLISWAMLSAGGYPVKLGPGLFLPPLVPQDLHLFGVLRLAHTLAAFAFFILILGHISAAMIHAFIRRDGVLSAIGFGKPNA